MKYNTAECKDLVAWAINHDLISYHLETDEEKRFIIAAKAGRKSGSQNEQHEKTTPHPK